jgi:ribosomal protein S18 acetylase RimI-like enzyme
MGAAEMAKVPTVRIRKAGRDDFGAITALVDRCLPGDAPFAVRYFKRYFYRDSLLVKDRVYAAEIKGKVIGVSGYSLDHFATDNAHWLTWFIVAPEYRGKENGSVAAKMLGAIITQLKRLKVKKVFVATLSSDARALRFYIKHGFEMEARLCDYYYRDEDQLILGRYI